MGSLVIELLEGSKVKVAGDKRLSQPPAVTRLLAAKADPVQFSVREAEEALRGYGTCLTQSVERSSGRGERDLLFEDDVDDGGKTRSPLPQGRTAESCYHSGQVWVDYGQSRYGMAETGLG